jgi:hypothetical protein
MDFTEMGRVELGKELFYEGIGETAVCCQGKCFENGGIDG